MPPTPKSSAPPALLVEAFRHAEQVTDIGVMLAEDGFDATVMRVLSAWEKTDQVWVRPSKPCPDDGRPTNAAWLWLCSGWILDVAAVSAAAGVARDVARDRLEQLRRARLIYPDGSVAKAARQAMQATIASRLVKAGGKRTATPKKDDERSN